MDEASGLKDEGGAVEAVRSDTPPRYVAETGGGVGEKGSDAASGGGHEGQGGGGGGNAGAGGRSGKVAPPPYPKFFIIFGLVICTYLDA